MLRWRERIRRMTFIITDVISIILAITMANLLFVTFLRGSISISQLEMIGFITVSLVCYLSFFMIADIYDDTIKKQGKPNLKMLLKMFLGIIFGTVLIGAAMYFMHVMLSRIFLLLFVGLLVVTLLLSRLILSSLLYSDSREAQTARNILIIGQSEKGRQYILEIRKYHYLDLNLIGYIHIKQPSEYEEIPHLGGLEELDRVIDEYVIDEIAVARPLSYDNRLKDMLNHCLDRGITVTMLLELHNTDTSKVHVAMVGNIPVLKFHTVSLNESQLLAKRAMDVLGAIIGIMLFGLAFIIAGPLIKLETPGPIIFKQKRVGKNGRVFEVWKFRSMGVNAEAEKESLMISNEMSGHMFKMTNDPRITKIGAFIRKTSIDELPQFYNVLRGDMSLVGTRPPTVDEVKSYETHHHKRISIIPGITGNWQVSGRSNVDDFEEVVRLDSDYIANWSFWLDIKILLKTVWVVFAGRGSK